MIFSADQILPAIVAYLGVLFVVAWLAERGIIPPAITRHPANYVLSLGVVAGGMASNGVFALAAEYGQQYLLYHLGMALMFMLAVLLLHPLLRLCRVYRLASLADLLTFRFRSQWVGVSVTIAMCITLLPLLALQIRTVADSIQLLSGGVNALADEGDSGDALALLFCVIITAFAISFGTRDAANPNRNTGLVTAIAFESLVKLLALISVALLAIPAVFDSFQGLQLWLQQNAAVLEQASTPLSTGASRTMLLLFFAGAVCMPHIFHMTFAENIDSRHLQTAGWGFPLYMLLLSLPILPLLWAAGQLGGALPATYTGLGLGMALQSELLAGIAFIGSLSAASAVIIVATLALANMCLNYLVLPNRVLRLFGEQNLYKQLKWLRRGLITALILGGYVFYLSLGGRQSLPQLAFLAFSGTLQFLPAVVFTPYWPRANRLGLLLGLGIGLSLWAYTLLLPVLSGNAVGLAPVTPDDWAVRCITALGVNTLVFIMLSLLSERSAEETAAAEICATDWRGRPRRRTLSVGSAGDFTPALARALGEETASAEVGRALRELRFDSSESRPFALRHLRSRIEANLSGMLGPAAALEIVDRCLPFIDEPRGEAGDFTLLEQRLERAQGRFTGLAADLDDLRRHYRQTLDDLPVGLCSVGDDGEVLLWNRCMSELTGLSAAATMGSRLSSLPAPWQSAIGDALEEPDGRAIKREIGSGRDQLTIALHASRPGTEAADRLILAEDITDYQRLQEELLHNERLASIGRLAAGVAHEIGNPITGIACLAQNLAYSADPQETREAADDILKQTERVSRIVESLINFAHLGSGSGQLRLGACNLADCVDEAIHLLSLDHNAVDIDFQNRCDREQLVLGDSQRLLQVFINLLSNARDASTPGAAVVVSAELQDDASGGERVCVRVDDCGHGIAADVMSRLFEPFFTTKDVGRGTGLGLPLVYSIMDDMGGSVRIESPGPADEASGTRVSLLLQAAHYGEPFASA